MPFTKEGNGGLEPLYFNEMASPELQCLTPYNTGRKPWHELLGYAMLFSSWLMPERHMRIELLPWTTHRINTRILEILARERLGYVVSVRDFNESVQNTDKAWGRLADGYADVNVELWPASGPIGRARALNSSGALVGRRLGFMGHSGWYVPIGPTYANGDTTLVYQNASGATLSQMTLSPAVYMRRLAPGAVDLLTRADDVPTTNVCGQMPTGTSAGGHYDCAGGTWSPATLECTPRGRIGPNPCPVLLAESPGYDPGVNERMISTMGYMMQIAYSPASFAPGSGAVNNVALFHGFEPSDFISANPDNARFVRAELTDAVHCSSGKSISSTSAYPYDAPRYCNYHSTYPESGVAAHFINDGLVSRQPRALTSALSITDQQIEDLLRLRSKLQTDLLYNKSSLLNRTYGSDLEFATACEWLKANEATWNAWIVELDTSIMIVFLGFAIAFVLSLFYTTSAVYRFYYGGFTLFDYGHKSLDVISDASYLVADASRMTIQKLTVAANPALTRSLDSANEALSPMRRKLSDKLLGLRQRDVPGSVSFSKTEFVCLQSDGSVEIELVRFGDISQAARATILTRDGTAKFNFHFLQTVVGKSGAPPPVKLPPQYDAFLHTGGGAHLQRWSCRFATVRFAAGEALAYARVMLPEGNDGVADGRLTFSISIEGAQLDVADGASLPGAPSPGASSPGASLPVIPIPTCTVTLVDDDTFPAGYKLRYPKPNLEETHGRTLLVYMKALVGYDKLPHRASLVRLTRLLWDRLLIAHFYMLQMTRFCRHILLWHHVRQLVDAITIFTDNLIYNYMIEYALGNDGHPGWCLALAFARAFKYVIQYRFWHYFMPVYVPMVEIKNVLTRKFFTIPEAKLRQNPHLEGAFLHAIATSSERAHFRVIYDYHGAIFNIYSTAASLAYILFSMSASPEVIPLALLALAALIGINFAVFYHRVFRLLDYGYKYASTQKEAAEYTYHAVRDWRRIRAARHEDAVAQRCAELRDVYNLHDWWRWLYEDRTNRITQHLLEIIIVTTWAFGYSITSSRRGEPSFISTGGLLTLLSALGTFNTSVWSFFSLVRSCARYSFEIEELAELMNMDEGRDVSSESARGRGTLNALSKLLADPANAGLSFAFYIDHPSYTPPALDGTKATSPCFDKLTVAGATAGAFLPAGLIGLRLAPAARGNGSYFDSQAQETLLHLIGGTLAADDGQCVALSHLTVRIVDKPAAVVGSLFDNLRFAAEESGGADGDAVMEFMNEERLWHFCRSLGMSDVLLGSAFAPGWTSIAVANMLTPAPDGDLLRLALASALLAKPNVLLVGGTWSIADASALVGVLRAFLDGEIDRAISPDPVETRSAPQESGEEEAHVSKPRAVIWKANDAVLFGCLDRDADAVLTLETPQRATLAPATATFADGSAGRAWQALLDAGLVTDPKKHPYVLGLHKVLYDEMAEDNVSYKAETSSEPEAEEGAAVFPVNLTVRSPEQGVRTRAPASLPASATTYQGESSSTEAEERVVYPVNLTVRSPEERPFALACP